MFILQIFANATFELWAVYNIIQGFRENGLRGKKWRFDLSLFGTILHIMRLLTSSVLSTISMLIGAYVLKVYPNFSVIAVLPVCII